MSRVRGRLKRDLARFARARDGATVVEFALVALPFLVLMIGLAEVSLIGFAQTSLDYAVSDTARNIRTGQAQTQNLSEAQMHEALCAEASGLMVLDCDELYLDVDRFDSFVDAAVEPPVDDEGNFNTDDFGFDPGNPSDIVVVRTYYRWEIITPFFQPVFANSASGDRVLASTMMFRNEPYPEP